MTTDCAGYGSLNPAVVGTLMKEVVRRAIVAIRAERFTFEAYVKGPVDAPDLVTTADRAAQGVFVSCLRKWFPQYGIVAEEDHLIVPCSEPGIDLWFTVDPLDGTRAFIRRQSHAIGTMISLVCNGRVVAAVVGDVMTGELYSARPEDPRVFRISPFEFAEELSIDPSGSLGSQYIWLRDRPFEHTQWVRQLVGEGTPGLFRGMEISGGSIGIGMARLWKREVGGAVLRPMNATPWDLCPVVGISQRLGFVFVQIDPETGEMERWEPTIARDRQLIDRELLVIHESDLDELRAWVRSGSGR